MQNHLLQILALFAMETPVSLDAEDIRNEKVLKICLSSSHINQAPCLNLTCFPVGESSTVNEDSTTR